MYTIYCLINTANTKVYVGQTGHKPESRWRNHQATARHGSPRYIARAIRKYGFECFEPTVLAEASTKAGADALEKAWIVALRARHKDYGYNISPGGDTGNTGCRVSEDTREKQRASWTPERRQLAAKMYKPPSRAGCTPTAEDRQKKSSAWTPEMRAAAGERARLRFAGKPLPEQTKEKISRSKKGYTPTVATIAKLEAAWIRRRKNASQ